MKKERKKIKVGIFLFIIIAFFSLFALFLVINFVVTNKIYVCGDGTFYGECSKNKPYFCEDGKLIEKASLCGCEQNLTLTEDSCISKYQEEPKEINLKYILRGQEKEINFTAYKKLSDYLSSLPFSILYKEGEVQTRADFKFRNLNNTEQRALLMPLVASIQNEVKDKKEQLRIAVTLVQKIPYRSSDKKINFAGRPLNYSRYSYNVLYDHEGICGEKSELLIFLLRELGYKTAFFYYGFENHESVGVKCPAKYSVDNTGYCFIETTGGAIISDSGINYAEIGKLYSTPELIFISDGISLGNSLYEYGDAQELDNLRKAFENNGGLNVFQNAKMNELKNKYGLADNYNAG